MIDYICEETDIFVILNKFIIIPLISAKYILKGHTKKYENIKII